MKTGLTEVLLPNLKVFLAKVYYIVILLRYDDLLVPLMKLIGTIRCAMSKMHRSSSNLGINSFKTSISKNRKGRNDEVCGKTKMPESDEGKR